MNRRDFIRSAVMVSASVALPKGTGLFAARPAPSNLRTFELTTRVEVLTPSGTTRIWLPAALTEKTPFQRTLANRFYAEAGAAKIVQAKADALGIVAAEFPAGAKPVLTLTSRFATRDYAVDLSAPTKNPKADSAELRHFLRPTNLLPTDGIVKETALEITRGANTDVEKARAIYEWIVENTFRDPKTRGCGVGDIRFMLESKDLGGKCADLNALYVGLARAAGLPARDVYGIRVAKWDSDIRVSVRRPKTSRSPNTAGRKSILPPTAGFRLIPRTCGRSRLRSHQEIVRWMTIWWRRRERGFSVRGK